MATPTFKRITLAQFCAVLDRFAFTRQINTVHLHHTWKPSRRDFKGHDTIVAMWRFHTQQNHWRDIAQHITIDPNGDIWLGRDWNLPPASAGGHNGNSAFGPFMIEMIGNFDKGFDPFDGPQRGTALAVVATVQARFGLAPRTLWFHNMMSSKSCPGTSLDYEEILHGVAAEREATAGRAPVDSPALDKPFPDEADALVAEALRAITRPTLVVDEPADAEPSHDPRELEFQPAAPHLPASASRRDLTRNSGLDAGRLAAMRPHLVNLSMGRFSGEGEASTTPADVDAMFEQHLPAALRQAQADGRKLRLLFFAHGGLVSEASGLKIASRQIDWWKANHVHPIFFLWETGLFETLGQLLRRAQQGTARALSDVTTDPLIELAVRALQGPRIWGGMKASAEHAVDAPTPTERHGGGAHYVASHLKRLCEAHADDIELHAVGHSAGSIFLNHFLTTANDLGVPTFKSATFMAPALRVDSFKAGLLDRIGAGKAVETLHLFTMQRDFERDDNCASIYRKSLLYLIYHGLEEQRKTAILGLEESLRGDPALKQLFGLDGTPSPRGDVVWSVSAGDSGRSASTAAAHGDFDDDAPTMNSVLRRVLGKEDADAIVDYPVVRGLSGSSRAWIDEVDWPEELRGPIAPAPVGPADERHLVLVPPSAGMPLSAASPSLPPRAIAGGRRRALCVGIDAYPQPKHRLAGCVADARMWAATLGGLGFETRLLTDAQATRAAIDEQLRALVDQSAAGDVIVFQYAGHGTYVPDLDRDEPDSRDEALCPVDFDSGELYIDDDIAEVFKKIPSGVNMTVFMDCCHSGSNSRFAVGAPPLGAVPGLDERPRFVESTPDIVAAHVKFRQGRGGSRGATGTGGVSLMRDVKFAACLDSEVAWESQGHGEFTLRATRVLSGGLAGVTNKQFRDKVTASFGSNPRQHPMLDSSKAAQELPLLQALGQAAAHPAATPAAADGVARDDPLIAALQALVAQLALRTGT